MSDYIADTGEGQEVIYLEDPRFNWRVRKLETLRLAHLYELAGFPAYADRAAACSTWLQFHVAANGDRSLSSANFCNLRLCPLCTARRARSAAHRLSKVMDQVQREHHCQFIFLTLTIKNCEGHELSDRLKLITKAWDRFQRHRPIQRAVKGWFRALEITRKGKGYHPHIHAILAVEDDYFSRVSGLYLTQKDLRQHWQQALGVDYDPRVYIEKTYDKKARRGKTKDTDQATQAAVLEAAKYVVKSSDYISDKLGDDEAAAIVTDYTLALWHRRLTAFGGWMKDAAQLLDCADLDQADLVHTDDDYVREDVAVMVEDYRWMLGAGDYILMGNQEAPPKLIKRG